MYVVLACVVCTCVLCIVICGICMDVVMHDRVTCMWCMSTCMYRYMCLCACVEMKSFPKPGVCAFQLG